jgi:hypothetical protein
MFPDLWKSIALLEGSQLFYLLRYAVLDEDENIAIVELY